MTIEHCSTTPYVQVARTITKMGVTESENILAGMKLTFFRSVCMVLFRLVTKKRLIPFQLLLNSTCTAPRLSVFHFLPQQAGQEWGRGLEQTQLGQLIRHDQKNTLHQITSYTEVKLEGVVLFKKENCCLRTGCALVYWW